MIFLLFKRQACCCCCDGRVDVSEGRVRRVDGEKGGKEANKRTKKSRTGQKERQRKRRGVPESLSTGALIFHGCLLPLASVHRTNAVHPWKGHSLRVHWLRRVASELTVYLIRPSTEKGVGMSPMEPTPLRERKKKKNEKSMMKKEREDEKIR